MCSSDLSMFVIAQLEPRFMARWVPVRLANDRYEQFQTSIKRHAFDMDYRIAVDKKTGVLQAFQGAMTADGGGRSNFTPSVVMVGATAAQSIYYFPKSDLSSVGLASRAIAAFFRPRGVAQHV